MIPDNSGITPLGMARRDKWCEVHILPLLENRVIPGDQEQMLLQEAQGGNLNACTSLLDGKAQIDCRSNETGRCPLHFAAILNDRFLTTLLLDRKADPEVS